jgi:hypothetical protein
MVITKQSHEDIAGEFRAAIGSPTLPAAAKLCVAMATDYLSALQLRNDVVEVNDALASLRITTNMLRALDDAALDG